MESAPQMMQETETAGIRKVRGVHIQSTHFAHELP